MNHQPKCDYLFMCHSVQTTTSVCLFTCDDRERAWRDPRVPLTYKHCTPSKRGRAAAPGLQCSGNNSAIFPAIITRSIKATTSRTGADARKDHESNATHHLVFDLRSAITLVLRSKSRVSMNLWCLRVKLLNLVRLRTSFMKAFPRRTIFANRMGSWERWGPK